MGSPCKALEMVQPLQVDEMPHPGQTSIGHLMDLLQLSDVAGAQTYTKGVLLWSTRGNLLKLCLKKASITLTFVIVAPAIQ